ncbi:GPI ethanolamine phosphate transferase 2, partial [Eschrichtius robustus]|nr:GPI ethanolamine phosphate transferase 2 [Eschrichtius robustus]
MAEPGFEQFKVSERLHGNWIRLYLEENNSEVLFNLGSKVRRQYLDALRTLSLSLSRQAAQYDVYSMAAGTVLVLEVVALLLLCVPQALSGKAELDVPLLSPVSSLLFYLLLLALTALHVVVCTSSDSSCYLCSLPWLAAGGVMVLISTLLCAVVSALTGMFAAGSRLSKNPPPSNPRWSELDLLILSGTVGHVLSLGASSFIEEEHQTWYFLVNTLCLALCHEIYRNCFVGDDCAPQRCPHAGEEFDGVAAAPQGKSTGPDVWELDRASKHPSPLEALRGPERWMVLASPWVILSCCRLLRSLNQTGVQWAHRPDLGHWLTSSDHKAELSLLATVSLIMIFVLVQKRCSLASKVAMAFGLLGIYCYRVAVGNLLFPWQQNNKDIS